MRDTNNTQEAVRAAADADGGGTIDRQEFSALIKASGADGANLNQLFAQMDKDGDGELTAEEIATLQEASRIPFPRKQTDTMVPRPGESADDLARWKWLWGRLCDEIAQVHLWPSWEPQAFELLREQLPRLSVRARWHAREMRARLEGARARDAC